jgi:hypothetical protein
MAPTTTTRPVRRVALLAVAAALFAGLTAGAPAHAGGPAPTTAPAAGSGFGITADACGGGLAIDLDDFPFLPDDRIDLQQVGGVLPADLIEIVLVAGPGIDRYKAIRACRNNGTEIDRVEVVNNVNSDSMVLRLADVNQLALRKAGFLGIRHNVYLLERGDLSGLGGSRLVFTWRVDN